MCAHTWQLGPGSASKTKMATLVEGREYGLASNDLSQENKTVVHFKLTDTALKTLEDFSKVKNSKATIQFHGSDGVIKIPSHGGRPEQIFQISLSALPVDINASLDCLQQLSKHGESSLLSLGTMQNRITVLAKEDVFDRTKAKMTKAEEENKKVCTKEIKPSGRHISKKVKKIVPVSSLKYPQLVKKPSVVSLNGGPGAANRVQTYRNSPSPSSLSSSSSSLLSQGQTKQSPAVNSNSSLVSQGQAKQSPAVNSNSSLLSQGQAKQSPAVNSNSSLLSQGQNKLSPAVNSNSSLLSQGQNKLSPAVNCNSSLLSQGQNKLSPSVNCNIPASKLSITASTASRVLTSSAAKQTSGCVNMPYRDRIIHLLALKTYKKPELLLRLQRDGIREKDKNSLGTILQQVGTLNRDNSYILAKSAWAEVRQDWPFYTEQDRVLLKKNLQQESRANPTSPAVSPASSNPESPSSSQKRTLEDPESLSNPNKKKRISHMERRPDQDRPAAATKPALGQQTSPTANRENLDGNTDEVIDDKPDYLRTFVQIETGDQRRQYKQEFNKEYTEYRLLHEEVDIVARKFQNLRTQINQTEEGSPDFEVLKNEVLEQYEAQKSDPKFMNKKERMDYLHQKLSHIKRLIHDYDQRVPAINGS